MGGWGITITWGKPQVIVIPQPPVCRIGRMLQICCFRWASKAKRFSASGGFAPNHLTRGSAPGPTGGSIPNPVIGSRSARSPCVCTPHCLTWRRPWVRPYDEMSTGQVMAKLLQSIHDCKGLFSRSLSVTWRTPVFGKHSSP